MSSAEQYPGLSAYIQTAYPMQSFATNGPQKREFGLLDKMADPVVYMTKQGLDWIHSTTGSEVLKTVYLSVFFFSYSLLLFSVVGTPLALCIFQRWHEQYLEEISSKNFASLTQKFQSVHQQDLTSAAETAASWMKTDYLAKHPITDQAVVDGFKNQIAGKDLEIQKLTDELTRLIATAVANDINGKPDSAQLQKEIETLKANAQALVDEKAKIEKSLQDSSDNVKSKEAQIQTLNQEIATLKQNVENLTNGGNVDAVLKAQIQELETKITGLEESKKQLEALLSVAEQAQKNSTQEITDLKNQVLMRDTLVEQTNTILAEKQAELDLINSDLKKEQEEFRKSLTLKGTDYDELKKMLQSDADKKRLEQLEKKNTELLELVTKSNEINQGLLNQIDQITQRENTCKQIILETSTVVTDITSKGKSNKAVKAGLNTLKTRLATYKNQDD